MEMFLHGQLFFISSGTKTQFCVNNKKKKKKKELFMNEIPEVFN